MEYVKIGGSCLDIHTDPKAGWSMYWGPGDDRNGYGRVLTEKQTCNTAKFTAAIKALEKAEECGISHLEISINLEYVVGCATKWWHNWENALEVEWKHLDSKDKDCAILKKMSREGATMPMQPKEEVVVKSESESREEIAASDEDKSETDASDSEEEQKPKLKKPDEIKAEEANDDIFVKEFEKKAKTH